ncbi:hypothetical protein CDAR_426561 [Caerostris darwini]|uniref:Uncharacterized protein n=1 Tax=Caerostris darwini TaxID=1538125 RepID=A0AAV4N9Y4_9ARAC|nr:hypothetical protein CDAR_426561 [Caerostris darwini]
MKGLKRVGQQQTNNGYLSWHGKASVEEISRIVGCSEVDEEYFSKLRTLQGVTFGSGSMLRNDYVEPEKFSKVYVSEGKPKSFSSQPAHFEHFERVCRTPNNGRPFKQRENFGLFEQLLRK